jgi:hypothetical protein
MKPRAERPAPDRGCRPRARRLALAISGLVVLLPATLPAVDLSGSIQLYTTATDNGDQQFDLLDQRYSFNLHQRLSEFISLRFGYQHSEFDSKAGTGERQSRRSREPRLELLYSRPTVSALFALQDRTADGTFAANNFDASAFLANVAWRPRHGPSFTLGYRDETNTADEAVFGRDVASRYLSLGTYYNREFWGLSYAFQRNEIDNRAAGLDSAQDRHEVRAFASRSFADDRWTVSVNSSLSQLDRRTRAATGADLAEPVPASRGLFSVDTSPELGELATADELVDGNRETPAAPGIDIGGGATFRNIGLELPFLSPVSRLEISVDALSSPTVVWEVYHSPDNLTWQRVDAVSSRFDGALLFYDLRFPQVTDRYVKAVNISVNAEPTVQVTEVRALLERDFDGQQDGFESTLYTADLRTTFRPVERVVVTLNAGTSNDQDLANGFVRRDFEEKHGGAQMGIDLLSSLRLAIGYRYDDSENRRLQDPLLRTVESTSASLEWTPLPTLNALLSHVEREESEVSLRLQSIRSTRLVVTTELLPDLRLITDVERSELDSPGSAVQRDGFAWQQRIEARPTLRWTVSGGYSTGRYETREGELLFEQSQIDLRSTWAATAFLTVSGTWAINDEGGNETVRQSYNLSYTPGPKFSLSAVYQQFETVSTRTTADDAVTANYRLNNHLALFASLARSRFVAGEGPTSEFTSLRTGFRMFF